MDRNFITYPKEKDALYRLLKVRLQGMADSTPDLIANLANMSALLNQAMTDINWVGFYLMKNGRFVGTRAPAVLVLDRHIQSLVSVRELQVAYIVFKFVCYLDFLVIIVYPDRTVVFICYFRVVKLLQHFIFC